MIKRAIIIYILSLCLPACLMAETVTLVSDVWCPYNCVPGSAKQGYIVEIARTVYENAGYTFSYKVLPWTRAVKEAKAGRFNGIIGFTKKNLKSFIISENEMGIARDVFFVKNGQKWHYDNVASLKNIDLIVYPNGYHYTPEIDSYFKTAKNVSVISGDNPLNTLVKMLLHSRADAFPENEMVVNYYLDKTNQKGSLAVAGEFNQSNVYVGFGLLSPTHQRDMQILSDGIAELRSTGVLQNILTRYGITDWR